MTEKDTGLPTPETRHKRKEAFIFMGGAFGIIFLIWLIYYLIFGQFEIYTDDAYVSGNLVTLMSQVSGTVIQINADDTDFVHQGQTIIKLNPHDTTIAFKRARAALAQTVRQTRQWYDNAYQAEATVTLRHANLIKSQLDLKRRVGLVGERAISREELQHYQTALQAAEAQYKIALHQSIAAVSLVNHTHLYTHPAVKRAIQDFKIAYLNLQRTTIVAPVTGYIAKRSVQVGQNIAVNTPMLAIVPLDAVWVDANYKESQLSHLRIGQPVTLSADAYDDVTYHGKVVGLNAGTGAAFALLPPQNATGNWIKIVQRLPVRISLDPDELKKNPLEIGLSMRVTVNARHHNGKQLATISPSQPVYETNVYAHQLADANKLIHHILHANAEDVSFKES